MNDIREQQRAAAQQVADTRILQKVNNAHREAFLQKFPGQVEHCLRLVMERLHLGLDKRDGVSVIDPSTWHLSSAEIADLAEAARHLQLLRQDLETKRQDDVRS